MSVATRSSTSRRPRLALRDRASRAVTHLRRLRHRHRGDRGGLRSGRVQYGPGVKARAAWLTCAHFLPVRRARRVVNALLGFAVSDGWVAGLRAQAAGLLETGSCRTCGR